MVTSMFDDCYLGMPNIGRHRPRSGDTIRSIDNAVGRVPPLRVCESMQAMIDPR
jgi:hypothetical protein